MAEFSHPVFGTVRSERHESQRPSVVVRPPEPEPPEEQPMADNDLRALIECGKITDVVEIDGKKFVMSTVDDDIQEDLLRKFAAASADAGTFLELRRTIVANALETFNGKPVEGLCPAEAGPLSKVDAKLVVVRLMQPMVIDKLYAFYEELLKRSKQRVDPEQVKNS